MEEIVELKNIDFEINNKPMLKNLCASLKGGDRNNAISLPS